MAFNFDGVLKEMADTVAVSLGGDSKKVKARTDKLLNAHREILHELAELALSGDLSEEELRSEIDDEMNVFKSELVASKIATESLLLKAVNAGTNVFLKALLSRMP